MSLASPLTGISPVMQSIAKFGEQVIFKHLYAGYKRPHCVPK